MSKIDISGWGKFIVGDLFDATRGKVKNLQTLEKGNIPVIAAARANQGVAGLYNVSGTYLNKITISCNGVGCGSTFYHPYPFNVGNDAIVLIELKPMTDKVKQFITCMLDSLLTRKYSYEEKCSADKLKVETIYLPIDSKGNPDWQHMEDYMRNIEARVSDSLSKLESANEVDNSKIDISGWGEFIVEEMFNIKPTKSYKLTNAGLLDGGESPVVVNSAYNNGIGGTSSKPTTELGNMITFSDTVDANTIFYQEHPFIGYSHVQGLYPIGEYANSWSKESLMFFASSFRKSALVKGFDYGNKFRRDIAIKLNVKLPIDSKGEPDWLYMENYMKALESKVNDFLDKTS